MGTTIIIIIVLIIAVVFYFLMKNEKYKGGDNFCEKDKYHKIRNSIFALVGAIYMGCNDSNYLYSLTRESNPRTFTDL